jgi:hypothetical protein
VVLRRPPFEPVRVHQEPEDLAQARLVVVEADEPVQPVAGVGVRVDYPLLEEVVQRGASDHQ